MRFEDEFPEEAKILADICQERGKARTRTGRRSKPLFLDVTEPITNFKIGRNEPCPCGSGKKFKKCCIKT